MPSPKKPLFAFFSLLLFISFILFSYLVAKEVFTRIDFDTTVRIQNHISHRLDVPFSILTIFGSFEITSAIWAVFFTVSIIKKQYTLAFTLALFWLGLFAEVFGKAVLFHPAPPFYFFRGENIVFPSSYVHTNFSYPSGHVYRMTFLITFISAVIYSQVKTKSRVFLITILFAILGVMIVSRIDLGQHWLSDVVGGLLLGSALGIIPALVIPSKNH